MKALIFVTSILLAVAHAQAATTKVCDPRTYGAKGDGRTKDTAAIQAAIDACANGGTVVLKDGIFLSGTVRLSDNLEFKIEPSATLKGSTDDADYPDLHPPTLNSQLNQCRKSLIYAEGKKNLRLTGGGTIDGSGENPRWVGPEATRPMAIFLALSDHVNLEDLNLKNAGMWTTVMFETDDVTIRRLHIHSEFGPTRDGIDIVDGHHVLIEDSDIFSEDDSICLKSGSERGVEDVIVRNCHVRQSSVANALKLGTASTGYFKNVLFENIEIDRADKAAMAVESVDGAVIDAIAFRNIKFAHAGSGAFVLLGQRGHPSRVGSIANIRFENVNGSTFHSWGSAISGTVLDGIRYAPREIVFSNYHVLSQAGILVRPQDPPEYKGQYPDPNLWGDLPAYGLYVRHVDDFRFENSGASSRGPEARPALIKIDSGTN